MQNFGLQTPLERVVGEKTAKEFQRSFEIETVQELLDHAPRRYVVRGQLTPLVLIPVGEDVTVFAEIVSVSERYMRARRGSILEATITDGKNILSLTWFNQSWLKERLKVGAKGLFAGKASYYKGKFQLAHPEFFLLDEEDPEAAFEWAETPVPIYPATAKLPTWRIAKTVSTVLKMVPELIDPLPSHILQKLDNGKAILGLKDAYLAVHMPARDGDWKPGFKSLKYREAFELLTGLAYQKGKLSELKAAPRELRQMGYLDRFDTALKYILTGDQLEVGAVIAEDLASATPMHRLLQGEVGSGKTLVALRAMLQIADQGGQSALLAPTEVLASQHLRSIKELLGDELLEELHLTLVTGQMAKDARSKAQLSVASGRAKIVVGTHALMSESTTFDDLGLVVIDEQHRFGVEQREALRKKSKLQPHTLVMTATPIPRTVALTAFGDLEFSTLRQMPAGRAEISSHVVATRDHPGWLDRVWQRAAEEIASGRQVYVVCPAIREKETEEGSETVAEQSNEEQEDLEKRTLTTVYDTLDFVKSHPQLSKVASAALTGDMSADDKEDVMLRFAAGEIKLLVATTVIEVGVNVPNASVMIVLDADRFGVSQLHQLRGRVGRGEHPGLALFVTPAPEATAARERVEAVASTRDGFELAKKDLELRREGDVLGNAQSGGKSSLKWLRVVQDETIIEHAHEVSAEVLENDPTLEYLPALKRKILKRFESFEIDHLNKS